MSKEFYIGNGVTETWPNISTAPSMGLTFNDVYIEPGDTLADDGLIELESRSQPDTGIDFGPWRLRIPIITAPMDTVSGVKMIEKMAELGGIGTLYRNRNPNETIENIRHLAQRDIPFVVAIGLSNALNDAKEFYNAGARMILIDIANGGLKSVADASQEIHRSLGIDVITGNIATRRHAHAYMSRGIPWARVGIGPGAVCQTRVKTGIGVPQLSAIFDTAIDGLSVIADGGIKKPGDACRALAGGAKMVMIGSMFAGTDESPGEIIELGNRPLKRLRGQASASYMADHGVSLDGFRTDEGVDVLVPYIGSVVPIVQDISGGLRSSMLYVGARDLDEYYAKTRFIVTSAAGHNEGNPHILQQANVYHFQGNGS